MREGRKKLLESTMTKSHHSNKSWVSLNKLDTPSNHLHVEVRNSTKMVCVIQLTQRKMEGFRELSLLEFYTLIMESNTRMLTVKHLESMPERERERQRERERDREGGRKGGGREGGGERGRKKGRGERERTKR